MVNEKHIEDLLKEVLKDDEQFIVDVQVKPSDRVFIEVDAPRSMPVEEYARISRALGAQLEEEGEDVELNVSSPGLTEPFKIPAQYHKNIGRKVDVLTTEGKEWRGVIQDVGADAFTLLVREREAQGGSKGKKNKQVVEREEVIKFNNVKRTKLVIAFK